MGIDGRRKTDNVFTSATWANANAARLLCRSSGSWSDSFRTSDKSVMLAKTFMRGSKVEALFGHLTLPIAAWSLEELKRPANTGRLGQVATERIEKRERVQTIGRPLGPKFV